MTMTRFIIMIAAAVTIATSSAQAGNTVSASVYYGDLDLSRPAGLQALLGRIKQASSRVCEGDTSQQRWADDRKACMQKAITKAIDDLGLPAMRDLAMSRSDRVAGR